MEDKATDNNLVDDFEIINSDETNQISNTQQDCFNEQLTSLQIGGEEEKFIKILYKKHHGSAPRFPGGNCVFASILTFMPYEKIGNMINYVLNKLGELNNEQLNDIIAQIFKNTPNTKNRDIISYMRAYVYIYLVKNFSEYFKIGDSNHILTNLVNGGYTEINQFTTQAFCAMTEQNILVFKENHNTKFQPILCSIDKNNKYSSEEINIEDTTNFSHITNYASYLQTGQAEEDPTVKSKNFMDKDTISIFCFGNHCTPLVGEQNIHFLSRLGAKKIDTSKISNFAPRNFIMKKQFDVSKNDIMQKNDKLNWKIIAAITTGIILAIGVSIVSAFTFGLGLIPALLATKIAIGLGAASSLASFIYPIFTTIKNKKNKEHNSINIHLTPFFKDNKNSPPPDDKTSLFLRNENNKSPEKTLTPLLEQDQLEQGPTDISPL